MSSESAQFVAQVIWPNAPLTKSLVHNALLHIKPSFQIAPSAPSSTPQKTLLWSSYDEIDHELANTRRDIIMSSSYTFRKCLIRKHFLSRCISSFLTKTPESLLKDAWPRTYEIEISFADELDEIFADELWELGKELRDTQKCLESIVCIVLILAVSRGMADRGNGIRLFNDRATLEEIFEEFEDNDDDGNDEADEGITTSVATSQLRHFVIQFHLRAYCVASGALTLYLYARVLALFSATPYEEPGSHNGTIDLSCHLTNTCLQVNDHGQEGVRLLDELEGCHVLSEPGDIIFTEDDISELKNQMRTVLAETFNAALRDPVNFQPLPNAFELFGVDFLVTHTMKTDQKWQVNLLEVNAEPAIEMTGPRLRWILKDLFITMGKACVEPFFLKMSKEDSWAVGEVRYNFLKCLERKVRGD
ncbi:tubulin-tyrosine ligase [Moniliophthora roreri]|nr:tubulin-tyrosine ligase [Moniliophthora roreri]